MTKGGTTGDKGQRQCYGQCWECGRYGPDEQNVTYISKELVKDNTLTYQH